MKIIYLDGQYFKVDTPIIEAFTPGVFKAQGVFETMLGIGGLVLDVALHMKRLRQGLKNINIRPPVVNPLVFKKLLRDNKLSNARVRLMVWKAGQQAHVMAVALSYKKSSKQVYRVGLIKTSRTANGRMSIIKSLDYRLFAEAYSRAQAWGFDEALLLNRRGHIFEASRANIFWIKDKVLYTPPLSSGCLKGITRQQVIKQARKLGIPVKEKNLTPEILKKSDGAFLTNSLIGIKPIEVTSIRNISAD